MTKQISQEELIAQQEAMLNNMNLMNQIVGMMKEIPILPSEQPKDVSPLNRVEFPEKGGVLTYMDGHDQPYKGFPFYDFVDKIDVIKKVSRAMLSGLYHSLKGKPKIFYVAFIPLVFIAKNIFVAVVYVFAKLVKRVLVKSNIYCDAVRELHRVFTQERYREDEKTRELRLMLRDVVCMILEFDNAYRYRFQDILAEINQTKVKTHTVQELSRLLTLMSEREITEDIKNTWILVGLFVKIYLRLDRKLR